MKRRRRAFLLLVSLPLGVLLAEGLVRWAGLEVAPLPEVRGGLTSPVEDSALRYENRPDARQVVTYRESADGPPRRVEMRTNAQRLRGPEVPAQPTPGVLRIACVGDSHTFGYGVAEGESWPDHLRALAPEVLGPVEVLNGGVNAYDTLQEVLWYERRVAALQPDVVLLQYFLNDTAARGLDAAAPDRLLEWTHPRRGGRVGALRSRWRSFDLVCDAVFRRRALREYARARNDQYGPDHPGWRRTRDALLRLRDRCRADRVKLAVLLYPYLVEEGEGFRSDPAFAIVSAFCEEAGIPCVDASSALLAAGGGALRISEIDYHGNSAANRAFAEVALGWLRRNRAR